MIVTGQDDRRFLSCQYDEARLEGDRKEENRTEKKQKIIFYNYDRQ